MEKNKNAAKQRSWHRRATVIAGVFSILLAAGLCGGSSGSFIIFLLFEAVAIMFLGFGVQLLFNPKFIPERIHSGTQWLWLETKPLFRYAPGFLLMIWTLLPILPLDINAYLKVQVIPEDTPCLYLLFTPIMWIMIGTWGAHNTKPTIAFGLISHIALFVAALHFINSSPLSGFFYDLDILIRLGLLALIVLAAVVSTTMLLATGRFIRRDTNEAFDRKTS